LPQAKARLLPFTPAIFLGASPSPEPEGLRVIPIHQMRSLHT